MDKVTAKSATPSILLADGDARSREDFSRFFTEVGWSFDVVTEPEFVPNAVTSQEYDIVIADVSMPDVEGLHLLTQILKSKPGQAIIAVSSDSNYADALQMFRSGATDLLTRPIDFAWLERVVKEVANLRDNEEKAGVVYRYVQSERTEMHMSCRELAQIEVISLPIIDRLASCKLIERGAALRLKLAIQEAVSNGFEHGNLELRSEWREEIQADGQDKFAAIRKERLLDPDFANKKVMICSWFDGENIEITVRDEGVGFLNQQPAPEDQVSPSSSSGSLKCSGRGLSMMSSAVDEVKFSRNGSEVRLLKKLLRRKV